MTMYENPELVKLFRIYTHPQDPARGSTGDSLTRESYERYLDSPLIVATHSDVALFPGSGAAPSVVGFRLAVGGFKELAGISHLGPAFGALVRLRELGRDEDWRRDAERLLAGLTASMSANSDALWADQIQVDAYKGREAAIARMVDYACAISIRFLTRALAEPEYLTAENLRNDYLHGNGQADLPVPFNRVMIGTFGLVGLDISYRLLRWFDDVDLDWSKALVMVAGRQGRPTAGITKSTNSVARILHYISRGRLESTRLFIVPHAPIFPTPENGNMKAVITVEDPLRWMLARVMSSMELAPIMFDGYAKFEEPPMYGPPLNGADTVTEMPQITRPDDWEVVYTRLRLALEDPRQLLASGVTDYLAEQLVGAGGDLLSVVVPGLDNEPYPDSGS